MSDAFAYGLAYVIVKSINDYQKEKENQKMKISAFHQQCNQDIAKATDETYNLVREISINKFINQIPNELIKGDDLLPFYAFMQVLKKQRCKPPHEQIVLINFFIENLEPGFNKTEFISSINHANRVTRLLELGTR